MRWTCAYVKFRWPECYFKMLDIDHVLINDELKRIGVKQRFPQSFTFAKNFLAGNLKLKSVHPTRYWHHRSLFFILQDYTSMMKGTENQVIKAGYYTNIIFGPATPEVFKRAES